MAIMMPKRRSNGLDKVIGIGKMAGGIASGNPMGYLSAADSALGMREQAPQVQAVPTTADSAMSRRAGAGNMEDQLMALRDGEQALNTLPPEMRREYGKPLFETIMAAYNKYKGIA